jgi:hypothetical protein
VAVVFIARNCNDEVEVGMTLPDRHKRRIEQMAKGHRDGLGALFESQI